MIRFDDDNLNRNDTEKALAKSERRYRFLFEQSNDAILLCHRQGRIIDANRNAIKMLGYERVPAALFDLTLARICPEFDTPEFRQALEANLFTDRAGLIVNLKKKDGPLFEADINARLVDPSAGTVQLVIRLQQAQAETAREVHPPDRELSSLLRAAPDTVLRLDASGSILRINRALSISGWQADEMMGQPLTAFVHPDDRQRVTDCLQSCDPGRLAESISPVQFFIKDSAGDRSMPPVVGENKMRTCSIAAEGVFLDDNASHSLLGYWVIIRDITEEIHAAPPRESREAQVLQTQKMEAIGFLASGIAHDFNNILGAIFGHVQLAQMALPENHKANGHIQHITAAGRRAKSLVAQILTFCRESAPAKQPVELGSIIKEALKLLRASSPSSIDIRQAIDAQGYVVMADPTKIYQILMNLFTNALYAVEGRSGYVEVSVTAIKHADPIATGEALEPGHYLRLSVADNGCGMNTSLKEQIFEPYFTTKAAGQGTGLGLSTVRELVEEHGGAIAVHSQLGEGTVFTIHLPCVSDCIDTPSPAPPVPPTGSERILFVDDERGLAEIAEQLLGKLGYQIDIQACPLQALETFRKHPDRYQMVITDLTMPGMTGDCLAEEILQIRPTLPVLICTGFCNKICQTRAKEIGIRGFVRKPFTLEDLSLKIREALDQAQSPCARHG